MMKNNYKVLIISCWVVLICYCLIKVIFGSNFDLMSESQMFINVSNYIDNHMMLKKVIACTTSLISGYFIICAVTKQKSLKWYYLLTFVLLTIIKSFIQWDNKLISALLEIVILIGLPMLINIKKNIKFKYLRPFIGYILIFVFQVFSMFLSSISVKDINSLNTLTALLYNLEFYFLIILYYLYETKERQV